jgi:FlaA1/EpsC-like NDP-sugar epimerase
MTSLLRNRNFYLMITGDAAIFVMACVGAYLLRFEFVLTPYYIDQILKVLVISLPVKLAVFFLFGAYRGMWRYTSVDDFWRLAKACLASFLLTTSLIGLLFSFQGFPRSVFILDAVLTFLFVGGLRVGIRSFLTSRTASKDLNKYFRLPMAGILRKGTKRIILIGAGDSGEKIMREIFDNPHLNYFVVGFLDDDPGKWGRTVHGRPVLGGVARLPEVLEEYNIHEVFISIPSATGAELRSIIDTCKRCDVSYKALPGIGEIMNGKVSVKALRDVSYEDLLRRSPVTLDTDAIQKYVMGRTVLVTGCGGSIGSELCRQLVRFNPGRLVLLDAGEENLFNIEMELRNEHSFHNYECILTRVQHRELMQEVFARYRPQVVFHAAAYKHVPMLERNLWEAVHNNVQGSRVVMELAVEYGVQRFVLVSTDKAVRPTNVMGASKRVTEMIMHSLQGKGTEFRAVRFGNVAGSSGSVLPLFRRQIEQGGPVTVTHPEVTRYFMTISEAAQLILQAGALAEGGEIFVLEMGTAVKIADMALDLIRLSGKEPGKDIEVVFTGLRPGEKLYEELITHGENIVTTRHEKIMVLKPNGSWNGADKQEDFRQWLNQRLEELYQVATTHDAGAIKRKLQEIVPEYTPQETDHDILNGSLGGRAVNEPVNSVIQSVQRNR